MKITRILPRQLALAYQEHDLRRVDAALEYHKTILMGLEERSLEGHAELRRLRELKRSGKEW